MPVMNKETIVEITRTWLQNFVIDLNLCPFAGKVFLEDSIRFTVFFGESEEALLETLQGEIKKLQIDSQIATTLLILPNVLQDFEDYNQFLELSDLLLVESQNEFQVASFHPDYQFAGTKLADAENFSNRSPFPLLHILRESMVTDVVDNHRNTHEIPANNIRHLRGIGAAQLRNQLTAIHNSSSQNND